MHSRLAIPRIDALDPQQRAIRDAIVASRGSIDGPFLAWLLVPGLADPAQQLGAFCRYQTSLARVELELLILVVAAELRCEAEQQIHEPIALAAGLASQAVDSIRIGHYPDLGPVRLRLLYQVARCLVRKSRIPERLYALAVGCFGEKSMVEIVTVVGYYSMVGLTLNAFEMKVRVAPLLS
ncbi:MAG: carboxymuconolactone decarboxylase family protein [Comamonadaceae bacterium]|nr:MAG: carboxymuconolactone decarboxylase family protein [Comamonadaceae bacterium]